MAMANPTLPRARGMTPYLAAALFGWLVIAVTTVHHVWGAILYDTPWRLHIVFIGVPIALLFSLLLGLAAGRHGTKSGWLFAVLGAILIVVEATGIAHVPAGILAAVASWRMIRWAR